MMYQHISILLISVLISSSASLYPILANRIGLDLFTNRITQLREASVFQEAPRSLSVCKSIYSIENANTFPLAISSPDNRRWSSSHLFRSIIYRILPRSLWYVQ
jgi:hypothetical protein